MKIQFSFLLAILVLLANTHHLQSCRTIKDDQQNWSIDLQLLQQSLQRVPVPPSAKNGDTNIPVPVGQRAFAGKTSAALARNYS
ncbi:hypothetical protein Csa_011112 [Cucumis sativus]|uniref:Uncharacterized protein n=1 Tax=Cucumis sativus TaxID=3659 RepID=A0A0A0LCY5_CUCSA|nr:hypothetical protein Csa_011112 [Cucumis sativus]